MNNRMKELMIQAGYPAPELASRAQKLTELIVLDCCQALWTNECHVSDLAYDEYHRSVKKIKEHFGVN